MFFRLPLEKLESEQGLQRKLPEYSELLINLIKIALLIVSTTETKYCRPTRSAPKTDADIKKISPIFTRSTSLSYSESESCSATVEGHSLPGNFNSQILGKN